MIDRNPAILNRDVFDVALSVCMNIDEDTVQYGNVVLYRLLYDDNMLSMPVEYVLGYTVHNGEGIARPVDWIEYDDAIYDIQAIYDVYSNCDEWTSYSMMGVRYLTKSIYEAYYYSKNLYDETGLTKFPRSPLGRDRDEIIDGILKKCSGTHL